MRGARSRAALFAGAAALASIVAFATPADADVRVEALPVLGKEIAVGEGWLDYVVRVESDDAATRKGTVEIVALETGGRAGPTLASAPFAAAGGALSLRIPVALTPSISSLGVVLHDDRGATLGPIEIALAGAMGSTSDGPVLLDLAPTSRLHAALHGARIAPAYGPGGYGPPVRDVHVATPPFDAKSGDALVPERPAGYGPTTLVLARGDALERLGAREAETLADWVLGGGSLAIVPARPEHLRGSVLVALVGGAVELAEPPRALVTERIELPAAPTLERQAPLPAPDADAGAAEDDAEPEAPGPAPAEGTPVATPAFPAEAILAKLTGYRGGNLRPTRWGAVASYGLGEVHLLAFDPTRVPEADDAWVRAHVVDLARHAWERRPVAAARAAASSGSLEHVERELDPNQGARWTIAVAALLLLLYAVVAGPWNASLAARRDEPLRAYARQPVIAAVAFAIVVALGLGSRGVRARARHLAYVEAGAGMQRGAAVRFRSFFTSSNRKLDVRGADSRSVLAVVGDTARPREGLLVERDGTRFSRLATLAWQPALVRDDGVASLGSGVSIVASGPHDVRVTNGMARALVGVVIEVPGEGARHLGRLAPGASALFSSGEPIGALGSSHGSASGMVHGLAAPEALWNGDAAGLARAWEAVVAAFGETVDWVPGDAPVVLAQVEGGEGATRDAGLRLEVDRVLLRVVGWGGSP